MTNSVLKISMYLVTVILLLDDRSIVHDELPPTEMTFSIFPNPSIFCDLWLLMRCCRLRFLNESGGTLVYI